jgi:hypothetical protein
MVARLNKEGVRKVVEEYEDATRNRQDLISRITSLREDVDNFVFDLYGLNSEERKRVSTS